MPDQAIDDSLDLGFDNLTPSFDDGLTAKVDHADDLRDDRVHVGVFVVETTGTSITTADGKTLEEIFNLGIDSSTAKVDFWSETLDADQIAAITLTPTLLADPQDLRGYFVGMPDPDQDLDDYAVIAWYDADGDGALDLSGTGTSETARPISKSLEFEGGMYPMVLVDVTPEGDGTGWTGVAASGTFLENYRENWISNNETDGWYANLATATE